MVGLAVVVGGICLSLDLLVSEASSLFGKSCGKVSLRLQPACLDLCVARLLNRELSRHLRRERKHATTWSADCVTRDGAGHFDRRADEPVDSVAWCINAYLQS